LEETEKGVLFEGGGVEWERGEGGGGGGGEGDAGRRWRAVVSSAPCHLGSHSQTARQTRQ